MASQPGTTEGFRAELRSWLAEHFTPDLRAALRDRYDEGSFATHRQWNATLVDAGYGAIAWPVEFGGRAADVAEQLAYNEEMAQAGAPGPVNAIGVANIAPAIMAYGTPEQQQRFLLPMLRGDEIWSQGMSEPGAGSDLASLRCAAVRDGDDFVVNGQKTWNSMGDKADWCQLYVRTDSTGRKHDGITCLLVDMTLSGIEPRPITTMAGTHDFAELFFTDARIPASALLGEVDKGWHVATRTLSNERAGVASLYLSNRSKLDRLVSVAGEALPDGTRPVDSAIARDELAQRHIDSRILEFVAKRTLGAALEGRAPGPEGSIIKLAWSQSDQRLSNTAVDVLGQSSIDGPYGTGLLGSRSLTIAGGTTEVNKNIVAERVLGLPKEPNPT